MSSANSPIPNQIISHFISLTENEIILYEDENNELHIIANHPVDENKDYKIYRMSFEDLRDITS